MSSSTNADFGPQKGPAPTAFTDEPDSQNSDQEDIKSTTHRDDSCTDADYWFGKIYFEYVLAEEVFNRATPGCSIIAVDSLLQAQLGQFPHQRTLEACEEQGLSNLESGTYARQGDHRTSLLILIGSVMRYNSSEEKGKLLQLLKANSEVRQSSRSGTQSLPVHREIREKEPMVDRMTLSVREPDPDLPKYSSILKEKGDVAGFIPSYNYQNVSQVPPVFKAVVSFQDYVFEGKGRTKQLAKHEASREACRFLRIRPS